MAYLYCYFSFIFNTSNRQNFSHRSIIYEFIKVFGSIDFFHFTGFAAACIILIALQNKSLQKIMQIKPFLFLGKISYSIYLMHWLIVVYIMEHWEKWLQLFPTPQITFFRDAAYFFFGYYNFCDNAVLYCRASIY